MKRILFAGYAPVHFVCFRPIYEALRARNDVQLELSGGRLADDAGLGALSAADIYRPFEVEADSVIELDTMYDRAYDMVFSAHISGFFPREDRKRVQVFHGLSFRNMALRRDVLIYDNLFVAGPYMRRSLIANKLFRPDDPRLIPTGFVKVDPLRDGSLDRQRILARLGLSGNRPILLYAPTGQRYCSVETTGPEVIRRLRDLDRYDILIKLHDHPRDRSMPGVAALRALTDAHVQIVDDFDIVPYLFAADLLITDASSVSTEFSLLNRPMVFLDVPELLAAAAKNRKANLDLDTWGRRAGVVARWPDEAVDAVVWSLAHSDEMAPTRQEMAADMFFNPGRATHAAIRWIEQELELEPAEDLRTDVAAIA